MLTLLFRWPAMPLRGLIRLAEMLQDEAERESSSIARRQLEEAAEASAAGLISGEELSQVQNEAIGRLTHRSGRVSPEADTNGEDR